MSLAGVVLFVEDRPPTQPTRLTRAFEKKEKRNTLTRCNLIKREKEQCVKEGKPAKSVTEQWLKSLKPEEETAWYARNRRCHQEKYKARSLTAQTISVTQSEEHIVSKGRRRVNDLIPFGIFLDRQLLRGHSKIEIAEQWRQKLLDPAVHKEEVLIDGVKEKCIEVFGSIQIYRDVGDEKRGGGGNRIQGYPADGRDLPGQCWGPGASC